MYSGFFVLIRNLFRVNASINKNSFKNTFYEKVNRTKLSFSFTRFM